MTVTRRQILSRTLAASGMIVASPWVSRAADPYPSRRVTMINQFAPGSISDAAARLVAQSLQDQLGQPFIVENKVGGGGLVAATYVARSAPDGYTLLATASSLQSGAALYKELPLDPVNDFTHIARIGAYPSFILVRDNLPIKTIQELVAYAKANPGKLSYGHGNNMGQIVAETFKRRTGVEITRVAYRSTPAGMTDLSGGHIDLMLADWNSAVAHIQSGKARPLAVFANKRMDALPNVPTFDETVMPGFNIIGWGGLSGPANLPPDVVKTLENGVHKALMDPTIQKHFRDSGIEVFWAGHKDVEAYVREQLANWTALIKETGIKPQ
jgi:tripartite-type tricarboxylate transporter receptor subunit TctC